MACPFSLLSVRRGSQCERRFSREVCSKASGKDKKLAKMLQRRYVNELEATSDELQGVMSPLGPMSSVSTRKLLINLIATMNASFPDFDFSSLSADEFRSEEMTIVVNAINTRLAAVSLFCFKWWYD